MARILITGATGAIGGALARAYAQDGYHLILQGRQLAELDALVEECNAAGGSAEAHVLDLSDVERTRTWCEEILSQGVPEIVYANAGMNINTGPDQSGETWDEMSLLLDLNVKSTLALTHSFALAMRDKGEGQLVLISSLAAFFGLPVTPSYSASKAAVKAYAEGIRGWLAPSNVGVTVVMPGYVASAMCHAMPGPKPFLWTPQRAARVIKRRVAKNHPRISFPFPLNIGCWGLAALPPGVSQKLIKWLDYGG
ncbi:SDR family NAD(P)-dependent oxidoreductase [Neptunomonas phycophila]|uniref:SDR family NAD(P)-dependent oxidoreductase n=1 Tax=Neptunomonas phycophila TaxID=1572645 RepID=UPI000948FA97|nr:SDR family NAD(P)-dependent oxidoreductase [Neptunomonas phycophila]QLE96795.1 SDR family NAD(P)-dependent oxidoreductase [Neptunomonas phycophila]